jgi:hypothetical protein
VTGDDFENGRVASMDWGNAWEALTGPGVSALYLATLGSGPAEAVFTW